MNILKFGGLVVAAVVMGGNFVYDQFAPKPPIAQAFGEAGKVDILQANVTLTETLQKEFTAFSTYAYFGAFAIGEDGKFGYLTDANDMASARFYALEFCTGETALEASGCAVYAELSPQAFAPTQAPTINHVTYMNYMDLTKNYDSYNAMAVTGVGHYGYTYGYDTQWGANGDAMDLCNEALTEDSDMVPGQTFCYLVNLEG